MSYIRRGFIPKPKQENQEDNYTSQQSDKNYATADKLVKTDKNGGEFNGTPDRNDKKLRNTQSQGSSSSADRDKN